MERGSHAAIATFYWDAPLAEGSTAELSNGALRHALVRRLRDGEAVRLVSGRGDVGRGVVATARRARVAVRIESVERVPRPQELRVLIPIADRERMLWAAEKCVEHQVTGWQPVRYRRSAGVATRGEGERFARRVIGRMRAALEQSGAAWLPDVLPETAFASALATTDSASRYLLDASGPALAAQPLDGSVALAVGPEGGFDGEELRRAVAAGWRRAALGDSTLRFETAIVSAVAVVRAIQFREKGS